MRVRAAVRRYARRITLIRELWEEVDKHGTSLGADVSRRIRKLYIGYFRGKRSFFTAEIQQRRVLIYLALTVETAQPWNDTVMRDATDIGHFGMGNIEYSLVTTAQLDEVRALISLAYAAQ
jgi:predicted transport protein